MLNGHMIRELIEATGKITFLAMAISSVIGIFRWKLHKTWARASWHFLFAAIAIIAGSAHLVLNIIK